MSKAFTRETDQDEEEDSSPGLQLPQGAKNYITPAGHARLRAEFDHLLRVERPKVVEIVSWAASPTAISGPHCSKSRCMNCSIGKSLVTIRGSDKPH